MDLNLRGLIRRLETGVDRDDLRDMYPTYVNTALREICERRSFLGMKHTAFLTVPRGRRFVRLPDDFKELVSERPAVSVAATRDEVVIVTPASDASDVTVLGGTDLEIVGPVWTGPPQTITVYGTVDVVSPGNTYTAKVFLDSLHNNEVYTITIDELDPDDDIPVNFDFDPAHTSFDDPLRVHFSAVLTGLASLPSGMNEFTIDRAYSPAVTEVSTTHKVPTGDLSGCDVIDREHVIRLGSYYSTPVFGAYTRSTRLPVFVDDTGDAPTLALAQDATEDIMFAVTYYRYMPALVTATDTNDIVRRYFEMVVNKAKAIAFSDVNDPQTADFEKLFELKFGTAAASDAYKRLRGVRLQM